MNTQSGQFNRRIICILILPDIIRMITISHDIGLDNTAHQCYVSNHLRVIPIGNPHIGFCYITLMKMSRFILKEDFKRMEFF